MGTSTAKPIERARADAARRKHAARALRAIGVGVIGGASALFLLGGVLTRLEPTWWTPPDPTDPRVVDAAESLERAFTSVLSRTREMSADPGRPGVKRSEEWTTSLSAPDANAWLTARLRAWLASREDEIAWPAPLGRVSVAFSPGVVHIGARVGDDRSGQLLSAALVPRIDEHGGLWAPAISAQAGRLRLPLEWLLNRAAEYAPGVRGWLGAVRGGEAIAGDPVVRLGDGRRVRLVRIAVREGAIETTWRTEWGAEAPGR